MRWQGESVAGYDVERAGPTDSWINPPADSEETAQ